MTTKDLETRTVCNGPSGCSGDRDTKKANRHMSSLLSLAVASASFLTAEAMAEPPSKPTLQYEFRLLKGKSKAVCNAYLERLRITKFISPPYCGRPESDLVPGFASLQRVPLSNAEVIRLFPRVSGFFLRGRQGSTELDRLLDEAAWQRGAPSPLESPENITAWLDRHEIVAWKYKPDVDLVRDESRSGREMVIWQGMPTSNALGQCGTDFRSDLAGSDLQPQQALYVTPDFDSIDEEKTRNVFSHITNAGSAIRKSDRPYGVSTGIFRYRENFYWDTFIADSPATSSFRLIVLEPRVQGSVEICEYSMTTRTGRLSSSHRDSK